VKKRPVRVRRRVKVKKKLRLKTESSKRNDRVVKGFSTAVRTITGGSGRNEIQGTGGDNMRKAA